MAVWIYRNKYIHRLCRYHFDKIKDTITYLHLSYSSVHIQFVLKFKFIDKVNKKIETVSILFITRSDFLHICNHLSKLWQLTFAVLYHICMFLFVLFCINCFPMDTCLFQQTGSWKRYIVYYISLLKLFFWVFLILGRLDGCKKYMGAIYWILRTK